MGEFGSPGVSGTGSAPGTVRPVLPGPPHATQASTERASAAAEQLCVDLMAVVKNSTPRCYTLRSAVVAPKLLEEGAHRVVPNAVAPVAALENFEMPFAISP
jgi:hypothetical protein